MPPGVVGVQEVKAMKSPDSPGLEKIKDQENGPYLKQLQRSVSGSGSIPDSFDGTLGKLVSYTFHNLDVAGNIR